ncbi:MAG: methylated-DNA--[protein]-cysteine S-methyltransferase, partial [Holophaga sp.]|nr:methylated-DNA--[protein]-cysteine S-methyltransferase [Holophaga sp.]
MSLLREPKRQYAARWEGPLGEMVLVSNGTALAGLYFAGQKHYPVQSSDWVWDSVVAPFSETIQQLTAYFHGDLTVFRLPMDPTGTAFQKQVWQALEAIPYGTFITYSDLAQHMGRAGSERAVGTAVGRNPLSILIPCHRVIGRDGTLRGYAGGLEKKAAL